MFGTEKLLTQITSNKANDLPQSQSLKLTKAKSVEKQPSKLEILILFIITIALYGFCLGELSPTMTDTVEVSV